jgi:para-nitrobenzyl esterase
MITVLVLVSAVMTMSSFAEDKQPIRIDTGLVMGTPGRDTDITAFKGIPYAEPPVGNLRWTAPHAPASWRGIRKADQFGNACAQIFPQGKFPKSEDCLYLNVWTPAKSAGVSLPVMVWIHGGGFRVGSTSEPLYDGEELARKGVVVVTLNYRLGVIGFFAHPELTKESPQHASGNYGLLDQLAALQWVQRNIGAFGGDPQKVTIFGQSAGAQSVNSQVASPLAKGLFRAGISESGSIVRNDMRSLGEAEKEGLKVAYSLGAKSLAELRAISADRLLEGAKYVGMNVDGWFLPEAPGAIYAQGKQNKVQILLGSNSDEAQHMIRSALPSSEYLQHVHQEYGSRAAEFLNLYPAESEFMSKASQQHRMSDQTALGEVNMAKEVSRSGVGVYLYYFTHLDSGEYNGEPATLGLRLGADHGAELPYVFGLLNHWHSAVPEEDRKLQAIVMDYWTNFAKTLDPNGASLPEWRSFEASRNTIMNLNGKVGMQPHPRSTELEFLQANPVDHAFPGGASGR